MNSLPFSSTGIEGNDSIDGSNSSEHWLTLWESTIANELESRTIETDIENEKLATGQKLWLSFQQTATSIAQVYVEKGSSSTEAFRNAARDATSLYKEGIESGRRLSELALTSGYNRRSKEILQWAKKRRRFIRRDELIGMLAGIIRKPSPPHNSSSSFVHYPVHNNTTNHHHHFHHHNLLGNDNEQSNNNGLDSDLATFRAAVSRHNPNLSTIVSSEFSKINNKRSSSPQQQQQQSDVNMDSPTPPIKKTRFF